jgi:GYF domain 2/Short C-terminal domain/Domain of unknown function (DUF4429)
MEARYYYVDAQNQAAGPVTLEDLKALLNAKQISAATQVVIEGQSAWQRLSAVVPSLLTASIGKPPPLPQDSQAETGPKPVYSMTGVAGLLNVFETKVEITPKGLLGFMNKGMKGTKTIPFHSITAIQFKEAGTFTSGYLQFTVPGGNESRGGLMAAASDENTFMFTKDENGNERAKEIKNFIENQVQELRAPKPGAAVAQASVADEIKKLAELKEQGILTDEEFQAAKRRLIAL